jgi:hypothetical protein
VFHIFLAFIDLTVYFIDIAENLLIFMEIIAKFTIIFLGPRDIVFHDQIFLNSLLLKLSQGAIFVIDLFFHILDHMI